MTTLENNLIRFTNNKLSNWYKNAKIDYDVDGSATCKIINDRIIVDYIENNVSKTWSMCYYPEYVLENGMSYFYNVWTEEG